MVLLPKVSVILPYRNEEETIAVSVGSIADQDYTGQVEIVAVNDGSTDRSFAVLSEIARNDPNVRMVESTGVGEAHARNAAMAAATGQIIVNFSAHAIASKSFLRTLVSKLRQYCDDVAGVGCKHLAANRGQAFSKAFGLAMRSAFGGFATSYYQSRTERMTRSVAFAAYRARVFKEVGLFDPSVAPATDAEFNDRIIEAGYKLVYTPDTIVYHHEVSSPQVFFRKMMGYGAGRAKSIRKHALFFRPIHAVPSIALLLGMSLLVAGLYEPKLHFVLLGMGVMYTSCAVIASARLALGGTLLEFLRVLVAYPLIHVGYGIGFVRGVFWPKRVASRRGSPIW